MKNKNLASFTNKTFRSWLSVVALVALTGCQEAREHRLIIPDSWNPALGQVQGFVEQKLKDKAQLNQQFLVMTSQNLADLSDARLFILYVRLTELLSEQERFELFNEQQTWLNDRKQASSAAVVSRGGSLAPLEYNAIFRDMTEARILDLSRRLEKASHH